MIRTDQDKIHTARETQKTILEEAVTAGIDDTAPTKLEILENEITQGDYEQKVEITIIMTNLDKTQSRNEWRTYI